MEYFKYIRFLGGTPYEELEIPTHRIVSIHRDSTPYNNKKTRFIITDIDGFKYTLDYDMQYDYTKFEFSNILKQMVSYSDNIYLNEKLTYVIAIRTNLKENRLSNLKFGITNTKLKYEWQYDGTFNSIVYDTI